MKKRSTVVNGRKTSLSLEDEFFTFLKEHAAAVGLPFCRLVENVAASNRNTNLSSALRVYALDVATRAKGKP